MVQDTRTISDPRRMITHTAHTPQQAVLDFMIATIIQVFLSEVSLVSTLTKEETHLLNHTHMYDVTNAPALLSCKNGSRHLVNTTA